ncbi:MULTISPECIES: hypothetical protein [unclassified Duganella]|uniref:hypothetical protein n=1 Tax=unclassified Duganella TaxID=2636909 RepID=UPI0006FDFA6A|nr:MULTISPECIES: hypothetical protein [unclassified Duganella]KQV47646.1 hypothetical protein ASD07_11975 [Duganella sp. Root336D2]KRB82063.1 hypothetical protein ASE26_14295 [Duganella sp. Root198D2]
MLILFAALMTGFAIGKFMPDGRGAYRICIPASIVAYGLIKTLVAGFPDMAMLIAVGVLQSPLLMLGVFLARRNTRRNTFEAD